MSKVCVVCGKGPVAGNNVSHSHKKTKRTFAANVQKTAVEIDGKVTHSYVCTKCKKTAKKNSQ